MENKRKFFDVPIDDLFEFTELVEENDMEALIVGVTDDEEIQLALDYERDQSAAILDMIEFIESLE